MFRWISIALLAATAVSAPLSVSAADESPWYAGAGIGRGEAKRPGSWVEQADLAFKAQGVTSVTNIGTGSTAWKLYGGYQWDENLGVEAGYARLGRFNGVSNVTAPAAATGSGTWDASAFSLAAVGTLPIKERFAAIGKLGLAYTRLSVSATAPGAGGAAVAFNPSNDRVNLMLGLGLRFDLSKKVGLRAEYEQYSNVGDATKTGQTAIGVWSLGAQYRF